MISNKCILKFFFHFCVLAYRWVSRHIGQSLPESSVKGGKDVDGCTIYVGRAFHNGDTVPAKVIPEKQAVYICHGGEEHLKNEFEVKL